MPYFLISLPANHVPCLWLQPLPEKHSLLGQLDRYQRDFIRSRMALLHRFMNRVADHPVLSCNESFKLFLVSKPSVRARVTQLG